MDTKELHAYIRGPNLKTLTRWIEFVVLDLQEKEAVDLVREIGLTLVKFGGIDESLVLEQLADTDWLELTIRPKTAASLFSSWDDLQLGERIVDGLGGITLVDCGGIYADPLAPVLVRISPDKMELVELPETMSDPFDEARTQLIKRR